MHVYVLCAKYHLSLLNCAKRVFRADEQNTSGKFTALPSSLSIYFFVSLVILVLHANVGDVPPRILYRQVCR